MRTQCSRTMLLVTAAGVSLAVAVPVRADPVAEFYKGRSITIVVGHQAGTGFDLYARLLSRHMGRYVPGNPGLIVQNMPGASALQAANHTYSIAPKDGTAMVAFVHTAPLDPVLGDGAGRFDPVRFTWIGNLESSVATCVVTKASGIDTFAQLQQRETVFGATGGSGPLSQFAYAIRNVLGAKVRLVQGYQGAASIGIAMQRGEVAGMCGANTSFMYSFWADPMTSGEFKAIIQLNGEKQPRLGAIAHAYDLAKSEDDRRLFDLIFGPLSLGRIYAAPPDVPADRAAALRKAFLDTAKDAQFLADAEKSKLDIAPMSGEEVAALVTRYVSAPKVMIALAKRAIEP